MTTNTIATRANATKAISITLSVLKWFGLVMLWCVQYTMYVPFIGAPLALLRVGGKVVLVLLCCTVIGILPVVIYLALRNNTPKERRSMWKPWGLK